MEGQLLLDLRLKLATTVGKESTQPGRPELAHHIQRFSRSYHTAHQGSSTCHRLRGEEIHASQQGITGLPEALTPASVHNVIPASSTARRPTLPSHSDLVKMSSHVVVVAPDVKRVSVKVNPGTYMFDVLDEACKKLNLQVDKWSLK